MKNSILIIFMSLIFSGMTAQDEETIAISEDACGCMEDIDLSSKEEDQYEGIKSCISTAIFSYQLKKGLEKIPEKVKDTTDKVPDILKGPTPDSTKINIEIVTDKNYNQIEEYLLRNCSRMKDIMMNDSKVSKNSVSNEGKAIDFYNEALKYFRAEDYEKASDLFKKALKEDKNFAYAWDNLGLCYRQMGEYKKAINAYEKSLKIEPSGSVPLMNLPIAYEYLKEYEKAIEAYKEFIKVFPEDPEGYYGIGRIYHLQGNYENAVEKTMKAFIMYNERNSPYARDAERNLSIFYSELIEKGNLELFNRIAKKYDIKIQE